MPLLCHSSHDQRRVFDWSISESLYPTSLTPTPDMQAGFSASRRATEPGPRWQLQDNGVAQLQDWYDEEAPIANLPTFHQRHPYPARIPEPTYAQQLYASATTGVAPSAATTSPIASTRPVHRRSASSRMMRSAHAPSRALMATPDHFTSSSRSSSASSNAIATGYQPPVPDPLPPMRNLRRMHTIAQRQTDHPNASSVVQMQAPSQQPAQSDLRQPSYRAPQTQHSPTSYSSSTSYAAPSAPVSYPSFPESGLGRPETEYQLHRSASLPATRNSYTVARPPVTQRTASQVQYNPIASQVQYNPIPAAPATTQAQILPQQPQNLPQVQQQTYNQVAVLQPQPAPQQAQQLQYNYSQVPVVQAQNPQQQPQFTYNQAVVSQSQPAPQQLQQFVAAPQPQQTQYIHNQAVPVAQAPPQIQYALPPQAAQQQPQYIPQPQQPQYNYNQGLASPPQSPVVANTFGAIPQPVPGTMQRCVTEF